MMLSAAQRIRQSMSGPPGQLEITPLYTSHHVPRQMQNVMQAADTDAFLQMRMIDEKTATLLDENQSLKQQIEEASLAAEKQMLEDERLLLEQRQQELVEEKIWMLGNISKTEEAAKLADAKKEAAFLAAARAEAEQEQRLADDYRAQQDAARAQQEAQQEAAAKAEAEREQRLVSEYRAQQEAARAQQEAAAKAEAEREQRLASEYRAQQQEVVISAAKLETALALEEAEENKLEITRIQAESELEKAEMERQATEEQMELERIKAEEEAVLHEIMLEEEQVQREIDDKTRAAMVEEEKALMEEYQALQALELENEALAANNVEIAYQLDEVEGALKGQELAKEVNAGRRAPLEFEQPPAPMNYPGGYMAGPYAGPYGAPFSTAIRAPGTFIMPQQSLQVDGQYSGWSNMYSGVPAQSSGQMSAYPSSILHQSLAATRPVLYGSAGPVY